MIRNVKIWAYLLLGSFLIGIITNILMTRKQKVKTQQKTINDEHNSTNI